MITLDYADKRPIYEQIIDKIRNLIVTQVLRPHEKIPSVRELAANLSINPNTIQKAYRELEAQGYIYSVAAKGNFVSATKATEKSNSVRAAELKGELLKLIFELKFLGIEREELLPIINNAYDGEKEDEAL